MLVPMTTSLNQPVQHDTADVVVRRGVGFLLDVALGTALGYVVVQLAEIALPADGGVSATGRVVTIVLGVLIWLGIFVAAPVAWRGSTPGMRVAGVRAVRARDGGAPSAVGHLVRMLCLIVDGLAAGVVGLVIILTSTGRRRVGDMAAGTVVVRR